MKVLTPTQSHFSSFYETFSSLLLPNGMYCKKKFAWGVGHGDGAAAGSLMDFPERSFVPSGHWHPVLISAEYGWTRLVWGYHVGLCC